MVMVLMFNISLINVPAADQKAINIFIDGTYVPRTDVKPFIEDGRTLVPVRAVSETMGAEVLWDYVTQTVTMSKLTKKITYDGKEYLNCTANAKLVIGQNLITIGLTDANGEEVFSVVKEMDVAAKIVSGRTFIPARFVGYALGYDVSWEDKPNLASRVIYKFIGSQTIDFSLNSENPVYDPVKRIDYKYDKEKYPDTIVAYDIEYPCRKGYDDIIIVDATNGRFEGTKMINVFPYRWTANNIIIECDDEQYKISENKTFEENFETYCKFYTDKVGEKVVVNSDYANKLYYPEFSTFENVATFRKLPGTESFAYISDYIDHSKNYYVVSNAHPAVDSTKMYYIEERPYEGYYPGTKNYGAVHNELINKAYEKNSLMFLNAFLGETGQRIWSMMNDYYTMSGYCYVQPETEWTKKYLFVDEWEGISFGMPDPLDGIPSEVVEKYGFTVVDNKRINSASHLLTLKTDKQIIYIDYVPISLLLTHESGYFVLFETIEN